MKPWQVLALAVAAVLGLAAFTHNNAVEYFRGIIYAGTGNVQLTNAAGNLATTTASFSSTLTEASTVKMTDYLAVTATGSTQADATQVTHEVNGVSGASNTGVQLPAVTGSTFFLANAGAALVKIYAPTGGTINANSANTGLSLDIKKAYWCVSSTSAAYYCAGP